MTAETRRLGYQPVLDGIRCFGMVAFGITGADRREYVDSLLATAFYVMNLYQWIFPGKPTAVGTEHFWSLGTEEQFYMVWPVVLIGMLIIFALAPDPRRSLAWATGALIVFCIVSRTGAGSRVSRVR